MITDIAAQKAMTRLAKRGFEALTETERTLATAWLFAAGVANNGFSGYFSSKRGNLAFNAPAALRAIGATQLAQIAAEANAVFEIDGPPRDYRVRRELVKALPDTARQTLAALEQRFFDCDEDIDPLLEDYLSRQRAASK
jgi:hypothetical protein